MNICVADVEEKRNAEENVEDVEDVEDVEEEVDERSILTQLRELIDEGETETFRFVTTSLFGLS